MNDKRSRLSKKGLREIQIKDLKTAKELQKRGIHSMIWVSELANDPEKYYCSKKCGVFDICELVNNEDKCICGEDSHNKDVFDYETELTGYIPNEVDYGFHKLKGLFISGGVICCTECSSKTSIDVIPYFIEGEYIPEDEEIYTCHCGEERWLVDLLAGKILPKDDDEESILSNSDDDEESILSNSDDEESISDGKIGGACPMYYQLSCPRPEDSEAATIWDEVLRSRQLNANRNIDHYREYLLTIENLSHVCDGVEDPEVMTDSFLTIDDIMSGQNVDRP